METVALVANLLRGGFSTREAEDIILWMAEPYGYDRVEGLALLEEMAPCMNEEEILVPQPWYGELLYLRQKNERLKERRMRGKY